MRKAHNSTRDARLLRRATRNAQIPTRNARVLRTSILLSAGVLVPLYPPEAGPSAIAEDDDDGGGERISQQPPDPYPITPMGSISHSGIKSTPHFDYFPLLVLSTRSTKHTFEKRGFGGPESREEKVLRMEFAWCGNCLHTLREYFAHY